MAIPSVIEKYLLPGGNGVATPTQLYSEAAPRVQAALKQYDRLAPQIDWVSENWIAAVGIGVFLISLGTIGGMYTYDWLKRR
jgi:hypothetical protein